MNLKHDFALSLAQAAMIQAAYEGIAIGCWQDDMIGLGGRMGLPAPDDVLAWVSGGAATDAGVTDCGVAFSLR